MGEGCVYIYRNQPRPSATERGLGNGTRSAHGYNEVIGSWSIRVGSDNLQWTWRPGGEEPNLRLISARSQRSQFCGISTSAHTVWHRTTKFSAVTRGRGVIDYLGVSHNPIKQGCERPALPNSLGFSAYATCHGITQSSHILHDDQTRWKFLQNRPRPTIWTRIFLWRLLMRDLFAVANLLSS